MLAKPAERHYQGEAGRRYQVNKRAVPAEAIPWIARLRAAKLAPHLRETDTVLEYGVGLGWNLAGLKCRRRLGFDLEDFIEPSIRAGGVEFIGDCKTLSDNSIDAIICHHTLEHVLEPRAALMEMQRLLAPGGKLLLFVPLERGAKYNHFQPDEPNHHLYSWNVQTLGNLGAELGYEIVAAGVGQFGYSRFAACWAVRLHLGEWGFRVLRGWAHLLKPGREVRIMARKKT